MNHRRWKMRFNQVPPYAMKCLDPALSFKENLAARLESVTRSAMTSGAR
jgi:hypothetical protein